MFLPKPSQS